MPDNLSHFKVIDPKTEAEFECDAKAPGSAYRKAVDAGFVPQEGGKPRPAARYIIQLAPRPA